MILDVLDYYQLNLAPCLTLVVEPQWSAGDAQAVAL